MKVVIEKVNGNILPFNTQNKETIKAWIDFVDKWRSKSYSRSHMLKHYIEWFADGRQKTLLIEHIVQIDLVPETNEEGEMICGDKKYELSI